MQLLLQLLRRSGTQPVEDVVVPLVIALHADPGLLQQVVRDESTHDCVLRTHVESPSTTHTVIRQKYPISDRGSPSR